MLVGVDERGLYVGVEDNATVVVIGDVAKLAEDLLLYGFPFGGRLRQQGQILADGDFA